jgi:hypothetical protein
LLANYKTAKEASIELKELVSQINLLESKISEFQKLETKEDEIKAEIKKFNKFDNANIENDIREIAGYEQSIKKLESELQKAGKSQEFRQNNLNLSKSEKSDRKIPQKLVVVGSLVAGLIVGVVLYSLNINAFTAFIVALISGSITFAGLKILSSKKLKTDQVEGEDPFEELIQNLNESIGIEKEKLDSLIKKYGVSDASDFYSQKADYLSLKTRLSDTKNQISILLGDSNFEKIVNIQKKLMIRKKEIETTVLTEDVINSKMSAEEYYDRTKELRDLEKKKAKIEEELVASKTRAGDATVEYGEIVAIEEELEVPKNSWRY